MKLYVVGIQGALDDCLTLRASLGIHSEDK